MRLLVITRNFPPLQGGMERLINNVAKLLATHYEVLLCGPRGAGAFLPESIKTEEVSHRPLSRFLVSSFVSATRLAWHYKPKIIFGGSGLVAPTVRILAWLLRCPAIVYLHGLDIVVDHAIYRTLFLPFIRGCDLLLVNSDSTRKLAIAAGIRPERVHILHPGTELPEPAGNRAEAIAAFRSRFDLNDRPILLSVGRLTQRKGLSEFIEQCMPRIVNEHPECILLVIGDTPVNALLADSMSQRERAEQMSRELNLTQHVLFLGEVDDTTLSLAYESADALIFPVLERIGDIEGFGMVAIEAAAHGTPTIAFAVGGVPDAVSNGISGRLLPPGNYGGMTDAVTAILNHKVEYGGCREFAAGFSWPHFGEKLHKLVAQARSNST